MEGEKKRGDGEGEEADGAEPAPPGIPPGPPPGLPPTLPQGLPPGSTHVRYHMQDKDLVKLKL